MTALLRRLVRPALLALVAVGCTTSQRPTMNPGVDCVACHTTATDARPPSAPDASGRRARSLPWSAAGTVFKNTSALDSEGVKDVHLFIHSLLAPTAPVELVSIEGGNFYTAESIHPELGLAVELQYGGKTVRMAQHPTPALLYGDTTHILGVGCNGCHSVAYAPIIPPDAGGVLPPADCGASADAGFPDGGSGSVPLPDSSLGEACSADSSCCGFCVDGHCAAAAGEAGTSCTSSRACSSGFCVDGACALNPGENNHLCTSGADCRLFYCVGGICSGAPGRISIPEGLQALPDGGFQYPSP